MRSRLLTGVILATLCISGWTGPFDPGTAKAGSSENVQVEGPKSGLFLVPNQASGVSMKDSGMLEASGATDLHNYGDASLVDIPDVRALPIDVQSRLIPVVDADIVSYRSWIGPSNSNEIVEGAYHIVSFNGPIDNAWVSVLEQSGATLVDTAYPYSLVVRGGAASFAQIQSMTLKTGAPLVRGITPVPTESRLDRDLLALADGSAKAEDVLGLRRSPDGRLVVRIFGYGDHGARAVARRVSQYAQPAGEIGFNYPDAYLINASDAWTILLNEPSVAWIELLHERRLMNNLAAKAGVLDIEPMWTAGWTGTGVRVNHNDGGIDLNGVGGVTAFPAGVVTATAGNHSSTDNAHGTHTAGSVAGRTISVTAPSSNSGCGDLVTKNNDARGMAYGATLNSNNLFDPGTTGKTTEDTMMKWAQDNNSHLSTNSWGYTNTYTYGAQAVTMDRAVRDADTTEAGQQALTILFAAGNDGSGAGTVGNPGTGKNVITVGASYNVRCGSYTSGVPGTLTGNLNTVVDFSGRGPSQGRIKPDFVAIGANVLSVASDEATADHSWDQPWTGANYELMPGTSMACPIAAGAGAVFFQFYQSTFGAYPSPALAKAALINGSVAMTGYTYENTATGTYAQGWGRLNLKNSIQGPAGGSIKFLEQSSSSTLTTGATRTYTFNVSSSAAPLKLSLVWTDPEGAAGSNAPLKNNLDLIVTSPSGTVYRGNRFTGVWSIANPGATADSVNNVENVFVQSPATGTWTVDVIGTSVPTNVTGMTGQDFAIAHSGAVSDLTAGAQQPSFALNGSPASLSLGQGASGNTTITSAVSGGFNAAVALSASGLPSGATASFSPTSIAAPGSGSSTMTINVGAATPAGTSTITVTGTGGSLTRSTTISLTVTAPCSSGNSAITVNAAASSGALATTDCDSSARPGKHYDNFSFSATAGTQYTIVMNSTAFDTWLHLLSGGTSVAFDDDGNGGTNSKIVYTATASGTLTVHCTSYAAAAVGAYTVQVTGPASCSYSISPTSASVAATASTGSVAVTAGTGCTWTATSNAAWLTITSGASGSGNGSTGYSVAANTGAARSGTLTVAGQTFTVNQAAAPTCSYSISPTSASVAATASTGSVAVTAGAGCAWTATSNAAWLTITSGASGSGNGSTGYSVAANTGAARSGTLTVAGQTFTVNQAAAATCSYSISPASASVAATASTGSVAVTAGAGCAWTATSNAAWVTITSGASGSGNGSTGYSVAANTGAARTGTLTVAGQTFTVNQAAAASCSSDNAAITVNAAATNGSLATTDCSSTIRTGGMYYDNFSFSATAGTQYTIVMNSTAFDAYLHLLSGATSVAFDDDGNGGTNSKIVYTATSTGTLTVHATSYGAGSVGAYTVQVTGATTTELVSNGGFESGTTGWTFATNSTITTTSPQAGVNSVKQLGIGTTSSTNIWQTIPGFNGTARTLRFYLKMSSAEGTGTAYDYLRVRIYNPSGAVVSTLGTYSNVNKTTYAGWTLVTISVPASSAVANNRIRFDATEDSSLQTTFFVDGVSIQ